MYQERGGRISLFAALYHIVEELHGMGDKFLPITKYKL